MFVPLIAFAIGYLVVGGLTMLNARQSPAVLIAFGFGGVIRYWDNTAVVLAILAAMYAIFGLNLSWSLNAYSFVAMGDRLKFPSGVLGWPFEALRSEPAGPEAPWPKLLIGALLVGWLAYAIDYRMAAADQADLSGTESVLFTVGVGMALIRMVRYQVGYASPRPIWARLVTGRLIVPGYDYVLLTPLATVIAGTGLAILAPPVRWIYEPVYVGGSIALLILIAVGGGPTLVGWRLTGGHRMTRMVNQAGNRQGRQNFQSPFQQRTVS
jgi:hypothetical protein